jgi:hypothetical protein
MDSSKNKVPTQVCTEFQKDHTTVLPELGVLTLIWKHSD